LNSLKLESRVEQGGPIRFIQWLQMAVLLLTAVAGVAAVFAHRRESSAQARWGMRGSLLLSLGIFAGTAPSLFAPTIPWLHWGGLIISLVFTFASLSLLRRQVRAQAKG